MGTRSVIARGTALDNWQGRYCHWDGYPSGVGRDLFQLYQGHFQRDAAAMLKALLDDHRGWSHVSGDWNLEPGFGSKNGPECYCHGERSEKFRWYYSSDGREEEYTYIINPETHTMLMRLHNGVVEVDLDGPEPDWKKIEEVDELHDDD